MMRRLSGLLLLAACALAAPAEPASPRLTGADLGRWCSTWNDPPRPLSPVASRKPSSIHAGSDHGCAALDDGRAVCWGWNDGGRLVGGDHDLVRTPTFVRGLRRVAELSERCARTEHGRVYCWDGGPLDAAGRRLISDYLPPLARARLRRASAPCGPIRVPGLEDTVQLDVGAGYACARQGDDRVYCWGDNSRGQLARLTSTAEEAETPRPVARLRGVRDLATGDRHACALVRGGRVACWGDNDRGQLGLAGPRFSGRPTWVPGVERATEIDAGGAHTCARRRDGSVLCWGGVGFVDADGRPETGICEPTEVPGLDDAVEIAAGGFSCARRRNGQVLCWRELSCGFGLPGPRWGSGKLERIALERAVELSVGAAHGCARQRSGRVACWGEAASGGLGAGAVDLPSTADLDDVPRLRSPIGSGRDHLCGLDPRGRVLCGRLSAAGRHGEPLPVPGVPERIVELMEAPLLDCALARSGEVTCWGSEGAALPVSEVDGADRIYSPWSSAACAHRRSGGTWCWGAEVTSLHATPAGEPADEVGEPHWHAEPVETPVDVLALALDREAVCGLTPESGVVCWPLAVSDDPLTFSRLSLSPEERQEIAPLPEGSTARDVSRSMREVAIEEVIDLKAAHRGFCGRTETGEIRCWQARFGAPGPIAAVPVAGLVGVVDWGPGTGSTELCAIRGDGKVACFSPDYELASPPEAITPRILDVDAARTLLRLGSYPCVLRTQGRLHCFGGPFRGEPLRQDEGLFVEKPVEIAGLGRGR